MFILKLAGKILLLPVWLILFVIGLAVKMTVQTYTQRKQKCNLCPVMVTVCSRYNQQSE